MVTVAEVLKEVFSDDKYVSGERYIVNNKARDVLAYWAEPGVFGVLIYRSVGRLFARGLSRQPLLHYESRKVYEVSVDVAASFIRDHGGFIMESEMAELGFGVEVARVSLSQLYCSSVSDAEVQVWSPQLYIFYEQRGGLKLCSERYSGVMRPADKHMVKLFARDYAKSSLVKASVKEVFSSKYGELFLRSNDIPERCRDFVTRIALLSDV